MMNDFHYPIIENYMKKNLDITKPRYWEQILSVPGPFVKSRFHCTCIPFVVGSLFCSDMFFSGYSGFPLSSKTDISNSNSTRNQVDEEPLCGCATSKSLCIILFYFFCIHVLLTKSYKADKLSWFTSPNDSDYLAL